MKTSVKKFIRSSGRVGSKALWFGIAFSALLTGSLMTVTQAQAQAQCFPKMPLIVTGKVRIGDKYGNRFHPIIGKWKNHDGQDFPAPVGTPVYAVDDGKITYSDFLGSSGETIYFLSNKNIYTRNLHLSRRYVKLKELVKAGQQIGEVGKTGHYTTPGKMLGQPSVTGPHLHFEVLLSESKKDFVDPLPYLCNINGGSSPTPEAPSAPIIGSVETGGVPNSEYPPMGNSPAAMAPTSNPATQASSMGGYEGRSLHEFLSQESSRRFSNPQWIRDITDPKDNLRNNPDPAVRATAEGIPVTDVKPMIWREIIFMMSLKDFYKMEKHDRNERIENLLATDLSERVNDYSTKLLETLRKQAASR